MKLLLLAFAVLAVACGSPTSPPVGSSKPPPPAVDPVPEVAIASAVVDRDALQATARRLAGLETDVEGAWRRHSELMTEIWTQVEEQHLGPMRSWAETALPLATPEAPLYYPFGGPDLPSVLQFFPSASAYVLVGLESPGRIPDLEGLADDALEIELERLREGLKNLAEAGYFVTKRMETDFVALHLEGVLPVLHIFLARAGYVPTSVEFIELDASGSVIAMEKATHRTATATRIRFTSADSDSERELFYFSRDLSNAGLAEAPSFSAFLQSLGAFNTFMKSASYLLHMGDFTAHKNFLVAHAGTILQDDSGIPLRDLSSENWRLRYFGTYSRTLPTYREWFQEDLAGVYEQSGIPALPFAIGYHSKIGGSCLIWAERRE